MREQRRSRANWILACLITAFGLVVFMYAGQSGRSDSALLFVVLPALLAAALALTPGRTTHGTVFRLTTIVLLLAAVALPEGAICVLSAATRSGTLAAGSLVMVAFSAVGAPHERHDMRTRCGATWEAYRRHVRDWWPRLRPYEPGPPARLWLDDDCVPCAAVAGLFGRRGSRLRIVPAGESPVPLWRARYAGPDEAPASGVAAVARGLGHVTLGWAYAGWFLQLPVVDRLAQLVTDALIAPPHPSRPVATGRGEG